MSLARNPLHKLLMEHLSQWPLMGLGLMLLVVLLELMTDDAMGCFGWIIWLDFLWLDAHVHTFWLN